MKILTALWTTAVLGLGAPAFAQSGGVVSSASPEATAAGVAILESGGNAIDAAAAVAFALGVTEPAMSGLGGGIQIVVHPPGGEPVFINGTAYAPSQIPENPTAEDVSTSRTASAVPSQVKTLDFAMRNYGSGNVSWADVIAPAARYAEEGWVVGPFRAAVYRRHEADLQADVTTAALFLNDDGRVPRAGDVVRYPVLARTLRRLAEAGADDFYTGEIAHEIADDMAANGGWITYEDLASTPEPMVSAPLHATYRGYDVYSSAPPTGGWVVLQALNILETYDASVLDVEDDARAIALLRALREAHASRRTAPVGDLVAYEDDVAEKISKARARALRAEIDNRSHGETTHYTVVDKDGMAVAVTTSIDSYFGGRRVTPSLGFLYNNYLQSLERDDPDHPYALRLRAMPYSSMSPTIVAKDGEAVLALGSPGSARIISATTQVVSHWIDVHAGVEAAVAAPRVHVVPANEDHPGRAYVESDAISAGLLGDLATDGFTLVNPGADLSQNDRNAYFGGVHAIAREELGWIGAADPRRDGAVGYADLRARGAE